MTMVSFVAHCSEAAQLVLDSADGVGRLLVLPDPKHAPASQAKSSVCVLIPCSVSPELVMPEGRVAAWRGAVCGTRMPKAAVDEDGELVTCEDDVGAAPEVR
jgi:hypothetical protein